MARGRSTSARVNLASLPLAADDDKHTVQVVVETPKGSRNKYAFDPDMRVFRLKKVLPAGMAFPYDFGFVPSTLGADGDPIDMLVLMDEAAFPGCVLCCRVIGAILGEQREKGGKPIRNDRLVAIESANHSYAPIRHIADLGKRFVKELEEFFVNYHDLSNETFTIKDVVGPTKARRLLRAHRHPSRQR